MALGSLVLRLTVGGLFVGHGLQKLRGSFGGPGLEGTAGMMGSLGMHPPMRNALAAAWSETAGGAALALGLATPAAGAALIATMTTAIRKVHLANGPWAANGGYEYNAVLIAAVTAVAADGPGAVSVDGLFGRSKWGAIGGLVALAGGIAASFAATEAGRRAAPDEPAEAAADAATEA